MLKLEQLALDLDLVAPSEKQLARHIVHVAP